MCKKDKIVVLLGSGFAIPFGGPTTNDIRKAIERDDKYGLFINFLFHKLDGYYGTHISFEVFLSVLESLLRYEISNHNGQKQIEYNSFLSAVFELRDDIRKQLILCSNEKSVNEILWEIYFNCIQTINNKINYDFESDGESSLSTKFFEFVIFLKKKYKKVKIYTTNYDRLLPRIFSTNNCSYYEAISDDRHIINDLKKIESEKLTYYNLHGSVYIKEEYCPNKCRSVPKIQDTRAFFVSTQYIDGGNPNEPIFFSPIIAGCNKTQRVFTEPFLFGFTAFANDCGSCDSFLSIGYSYSDSHINEILSMFIPQESEVTHITFHNQNNDFLQTNEVKRFEHVFVRYPQKNPQDVFYSGRNSKIFDNGLDDFLGNRDLWKYIHKNC